MTGQDPSVLAAFDRDREFLAATGSVAGREALLAAARVLAARVDTEPEAGDVAACARALHAICRDLPMAKKADAFDDFLDDLTAPTPHPA